MKSRILSILLAAIGLCGLCLAEESSSPIPSGIENITGHSFAKRDDITNLIVPVGVIKIDGWAFEGCANLQSVIIPLSVKEISGWAFGKCPNLTNVTILNGDIKITYHAFWHDCKLNFIQKDLLIPSNSQEGNILIKGWAFQDCLNLKTITTPQGKKLDTKGWDMCTGK